MSETQAPPSNARGINWVPTTFIISYHLALLVALPLYLMNFTLGWPLIICTFFLIIGSGLSITAGYHRLYSHRTYQTRKPIEWVLLFFGTLGAQGSVIRWCHDHRRHHQHLDSEEDPYETPKGFWHSHILWIFKEGVPIEDRYVKDLKKDKLLVFQDRYYGILVLLTNVIAVAAVAWITGDIIGAFVIGFLLRLFINHHTTWFINSLAHMWGAKPYSTEHSAVNNFFLAFLTYGEGYHNFHHTFASDYRNGIRWYQFDPTKYLIWTLSKIGLASGLKRTDTLMIKKKLVQADRKLLVEHLNELRDTNATALKEYVEQLSEKLSSSITSAKTALDRYRSLDKHKNRIEFEEMRGRFNELRAEISQDLKTWRRLCNLVLSMEPAV